MKAKPRKEGQVVARASKEECEELQLIGNIEDADIIVEAAMRALSKIRKDKRDWWEKIYEKYGLSKDKPGVAAYNVNLETGDIVELLNEDVPDLAPPPPSGSAA